MEEKQKNVHIIYERYYDFENKRVLSGGVQTYITNLLPILQKSNYKCYIHQCGVKDEAIEIEDCKITGYAGSIQSGHYDTHSVLLRLMKRFDKENDVLIFGDHILTERNDAEHSISIQHGIHWDIPKEKSRSRWRVCLSKARFSYNEQVKVEQVKKIVCVDYNFVNWFRTQVDCSNTEFITIPNFAQIAPIYRKPEDRINIIFARRFVKHRGTRVFASAIKNILAEYSNVYITIAGRGPDEQYMRDELLAWEDRVLFTQYISKESLTMHADKHIAIVPTIGSEGTSLSLLEAMSAQCAVVCTDVGGMTNVIMNGFNGLMVSAGDSTQLYLAIKDLIDNPKKRKLIANTGYQTVVNSFSYERWAKQWQKVIADL